ncbi:MAG: HAD-IA family hydrolase [Xenophilus sp.]
MSQTGRNGNNGPGVPSALCVIFDLDGTLVDSERLNNQAFLDLLPGLGLAVDDLIRRYGGRQLAAIMADLERQLGHALPDGFEAAYRQRVATLLDTRLQATPGTADLLRQHPFARCVASSAPLDKIGRALRASGLAPYFDAQHLYSSYDIGRWKPDPGIFLHAARAMGRAPRDCLVIEDSTAGLAAADAAGMAALHYVPPNSPVTPSPRHPVLREMAALPQCAARLARA